MKHTKLLPTMILTLTLSSLLLTACGHEHEWADATCTEPKTCTSCDETEGEALGHSWVDATCEEAKTCSVCGETEGEPLEHTWIDATCEEPMTCSMCGTTEGEPLEHTWIDATYEEPMTCSVCGKTEGEPLSLDLVGMFCGENEGMYWDLEVKSQNGNELTLNINYYNMRVALGIPDTNVTLDNGEVTFCAPVSGGHGANGQEEEFRVRFLDEDHAELEKSGITISLTRH